MIGKHILVGTIITVEIFAASAYGMYKYAEHNNKKLDTRQQTQNAVSDVKPVENKPTETKVEESKPKEMVKEKPNTTDVKNNNEEKVVEEKSQVKNVQPKPKKELPIDKIRRENPVLHPQVRSEDRPVIIEKRNRLAKELKTVRCKESRDEIEDEIAHLDSLIATFQ